MKYMLSYFHLQPDFQGISPKLPEKVDTLMSDWHRGEKLLHKQFMGVRVAGVTDSLEQKKLI